MEYKAPQSPHYDPEGTTYTYGCGGHAQILL